MNPLLIGEFCQRRRLSVSEETFFINCDVVDDPVSL